MSVNNLIMDALKDNDVGFVTTVPCKQLAGVIEKIEQSQDMIHVPSNREDEGMGLCAGAFMGGKRPAIIMQNTAIGVTINALTTLIQYYRIPLPMLISYRGEIGEPVACQVEMAVHTKALLDRLGTCVSLWIVCSCLVGLIGMSLYRNGASTFPLGIISESCDASLVSSTSTDANAAELLPGLGSSSIVLNCAAG